jgi:predicted enzyme related to lactoylglutathione lyase
MAVCHDPSGAQFDVWEAKKPGPRVDSRHPGAPTWYETMTTDVARGKTFYEGVFGWTSTDVSPAPGMDYTILKQGKTDVGGMMGILPRMGDIKPHWNINFAVANVDDSLALAKELGATIPMGPHDVPNVGRFAAVVSPQGVGFLIFQWK